MKPFFVLLISLVLIGCGSDSSPDAAVTSKSEGAYVAAIEKLGGRVKQLGGDGPVSSISLAYTHVTDARLEHLKGMTSLKTLYLMNTQITDAGLEHLKGMTSMDQLFLGNTQITDAGLAEIKAALPNCDVFGP